MTKANWIGAVLVVCTSCAFADSDMDPTWDGGGYTTTNVGTGIAAEARALAIDSNGRVVLAGEANPTGADSLVVAVRYLGDLTPASVGLEDADFHNNSDPSTYHGIAFAAAGSNGVHGRAVQIGTNDSVVVAGDCENPQSGFHHSFCLVRFTSTGAIDATFGSGGTVVTTISPDDAFATAMAKDSTGAFLVAGYSTNPDPPGLHVFTVVRYDASGTQDMTFGVNGVARVADASPGDAIANAIAVDSDDSIVVGGTIANGANTTGAFGVARLSASGAVLASFNSGNIAVASLPNGGIANAVGIDSLHRPIVGGTSFEIFPTTPTMALARFTTAGLSDVTFGSSGKVHTALAGCSDAALNGLAIDRSNRVFAVGFCKTTVPVAYQLALVHYNTNGALDSAYGTQGLDLQFFGYTGAALTSVVLDSLGRPVVAGSRIDAGSGTYGFVVNRHDYVFSHGFD